MVSKEPLCRRSAATLTIEEAGRVLGLSKNAAYAAANAGLIPGLIRVGSNQHRVSKYALAELLGSPSLEVALSAEVEPVS
jgi:helix-turn-helix protein